MGEGHYLLWFDGKPVQALLEEPNIQLRAIWWARVKTRRGIIGWVKAANNFSNQDRCG